MGTGPYQRSIKSLTHTFDSGPAGARFARASFLITASPEAGGGSDGVEAPQRDHKIDMRFDTGSAEFDTSLTVMSKHVKFDTVDTVDIICQSMPDEVKAVSKYQTAL